MEEALRISKIQEFLDQYYHDNLLENIRKELYFLYIDFSHLSRFDPELAEELLDNPEEVLKSAENAIEQAHTSKEVKGFKLRFFNLPKSSQLYISAVRSKHIGKFIQIHGIVRRKTDVRPQVVNTIYECPTCSNLIPMLQLEEKLREPSKCMGCGRKGKFRLATKELVDAQKVILEESPDDLDGGEQPRRLNVFLKGDLVSPLSEKTTNPGSKILLTGWTKEVPITLMSGGRSTRFELMFETNFSKAVEDDFTQLKISKEELVKIKELSKKEDVFDLFSKSIAPSIYGHEKIKDALVLQMFGGIKKTRSDGQVTRGDFHILLVGDPGSGKSALLKRMQYVAPKSRFVSGKSASGAGLTATVVKDEDMRGWALEAGLLVLANKGMAIIDEFDKMSDEDRSAMHEALEQQTVSVAKANINATLRCETIVLAAANPKFGRFDPFELIAKQIELPSTLINRFDLIFPVRDIPNEKRDEKMADFVLKLHQDGRVKDVPVETELIRKYIAHARTTCFPELTDAALGEIKSFYVSMRNSGAAEEVPVVPISARQLEALVRLSEASARTRLSAKVMRRDAKKAIELMTQYLNTIGFDPDTNKIDIDRITTGITATSRGNIHKIKGIIRQLEEETGEKKIALNDIYTAAEKQNLEKIKVEDIIEQLKRSGDIFGPDRDHIQRL